jgi:hypothetical protein
VICLWLFFLSGDRNLDHIVALSVRYGVPVMVLIHVALVIYSGGVILPWLWRKLTN